MQSTTPVDSRSSLLATLAPLAVARLALNSVRRFPYLILTPMAMAIGVPRAWLEQALSLQFLLAIFTPLAGPLIERDRKQTMLIAVGLLVIGAVIATIGQLTGQIGSTAFGIVVLALMLGSLGKALYDPAMQAYVGDHIPYARRGMAVGVTELAWSGSLVTFGPLAAFLIAQVSLGAIFAVVAASGAIAWLLLAIYLPSDDSQRLRAGTVKAPGLSMRQSLDVILHNRSALTVLAVGFLISASFDYFIIIYDSWLRDTFHLNTETIGLLSWVFAPAELAGEAVIIFLSDRLGKRRIAIAAALGCVAAYLLLPLTGASFGIAVPILFLLFFSFEISTISLVPLATEATPTARGFMMTLFWTSISLGRLVGGTTGGNLYRTAGFETNMAIAAAFATAAALLMFVFIRRETPHSFT